MCIWMWTLKHSLLASINLHSPADAAGLMSQWHGENAGYVGPSHLLADRILRSYVVACYFTNRWVYPMVRLSLTREGGPGQMSGLCSTVT